ncbi:unnamed protein product, partial [Acanthoscelides obtectus]
NAVVQEVAYLDYNRFLPPPVKVKQTVDDLVLDEGGQFLNLPVNLALRLSASLKDFLQMPYDYFCPTVKLRLSSRTCKTSLSCFRQVTKSS